MFTTNNSRNMDEVNPLIKYPKKRIELPEAYRKIYEQHYLNNREGKYKTTSLSKMMEAWMHKKIAEDLNQETIKKATLEIGAGTLNQLGYEEQQESYDIVEPFKALYLNSPLLYKIRNIYSDISEIKDKQYDRITTIATFEHIMNLPQVVAMSAILLTENTGHLRVAIPNEGTILWKLGTKITGFEFKKKYGLDYQTLMQYEHVNTAEEIEHVLNYFFENTKCSVFGLSKKFAFYRFYDCWNPNKERVNQYLNNKYKQ